MIKNIEKWRKWETEWQRNTPVDIEKNFQILESLVEQARLLGKWPPENLLEGIEVDIRIAKVVNTYVKKYPCKAGKGT